MIERAPIQEKEARHECALVGITLTRREQVHPLLISGLNALQHRGQEAAGIAWDGKKKIKERKGLGLVSTVFTEETMEQVVPLMSPLMVGIGHTRYSTVNKGDLEAEARNVQPFMFREAPSPFAIAHNGNVYPEGVELEDDEPKSDTYQVGIKIAEAQERGLSFTDSVSEVLGELEGAYSFLFINGTDLYAARDPWGIRPLTYGTLNNGTHGIAVASESLGLEKMGADYRGELPRGVFMKVDPDEGPQILWTHPKTEKAPEGGCSFEPAYFSDHTSLLDQDTTVHDYRVDVGRTLAQRVQPVGDVVVSVPNSGNSYARGVALELGIPESSAINALRSHGRSFIKPHNPEKRLLEPASKFTLIKKEIRGKRLIVVDDSIVRGYTMRGLVLDLFQEGAAEIHLLVGVPPIIAPCPNGVDFKHNKELAFHELVDPSNGYDQELFEKRLARFLVNSNADYEDRFKVSFLSVDEYRKLNPGGCYHCVTGEAPEGSFVPVEMRGNLFAREK